MRALSEPSRCSSQILTISSSLREWVEWGISFRAMHLLCGAGGCMLVLSQLGNRCFVCFRACPDEGGVEESPGSIEQGAR